MRGLPIQNRSTTMWLLCGLGVLVWAALSMLLSAPTASASEVPAVRTAASAHVTAPTTLNARATPGQGDHGHGAAPQQPGNAHPSAVNAHHSAVNAHRSAVNAHRSAVSRAGQQAEPAQRSMGGTSSVPAAVPAQPTLAPAPPRAAKQAEDARAQPVAASDAHQPPRRGITGQRHARIDGVHGHQVHVGHHPAGSVESHRAHREWHAHTIRGASVDRVTQSASRTVLHAQGAATATPWQPPTVVQQPPTVVQQPVTAADETAAPPIRPFPGQRTGSHPWSSALQASGSSSPLALDAAAAALPSLPPALLTHRLLHADDAPPTGPADSTEAFPD